MFLNLKGRDLQSSKDGGVRSSTLTKRPELLETAISLDTRVITPKKMSSTLVGNLGNDLMRTSIMDYWSSEKSGQWAPFFYPCFVVPLSSAPAFELQPYSRFHLEEDGDQSAHKLRNSENSSV
jgi:hypothetical protein